MLSYTGGAALSELIRLAGARRVEPLYGSVDPRLHAPSPPIARYRADLSYMGTYAEERQAGVEALFLAPARARRELRFVLAGSLYPADFPWAANVYHHPHVPPAEHAGLYCAARLNLNVTRAPMASMGFCPSGRLFEAAACGAALISDVWEGQSAFYEPKREILTATCCDDVLNALSLSDAELSTMAQCARERTLAEHTHERRAHQLMEALERTLRSAPVEHMSAASCGT